MKIHFRPRRRATFVKPTNKRFQQRVAGAMAALLWNEGHELATESGQYRDLAISVRAAAKPFALGRML